MVKKFLSGSVLGVCLLALGLAVSGCATTGTNSAAAGDTGGTKPPPVDDKLRVGDQVSIIFQGGSDLGPHEERIKEDGTITLKHISSIKAAGLSAGELQRNIHAAYVPKFYPSLVVTVKSEDRFFYVNGEVKLNNRYVYSGEHSVLKAIATAGGFTDFAAIQRVELTRVDGKKYIVDCKKAQKKPELDLPVYPGDRIYVPRRII